MTPGYARQFVSRFAFRDEKGKMIMPDNQPLANELGRCKNYLDKRRKIEKHNKRMARRKVKGLH